jgi:transmembrane sensor
MDNGNRGKGSGGGVGRNLDDHRVPDEGTREPTEGRIPVDDLIIQVLNGTASSFEKERLRRWRDSSPENEDYFQEMKKVWDLTNPEAVAPRRGPPSVEEIIETTPLQFRGRSGRIEREAPSSRRSWMRWGLLAASVAAVGLGVRVMTPVGPTPVAVHEATGEGSLTLTLEDGSFVRLAEGSTLREWQSEGQREVTLEGRGFFAVARDETRPFVIRAGPGEVRVLGTRFEVTAADSQAETLVVDGLVRVSNETGSVEVGPGSRARMSEGESPTVAEVDDVFALLEWPEGTLLFQATPLAQVVEEVTRHYGRSIQIEGSDLSQRRVTAWFQGEPFAAVAESLCIVTEAVCRTEGGSVTMGLGGGGGMR